MTFPQEPQFNICSKITNNLGYAYKYILLCMSARQIYYIKQLID